MSLSITRVSDTKDRLGESPVWDAAEQTLLWLDSLEGTLHRLEWSSGFRQDFVVPAPVGSCALSSKGDIILALRTGFSRCDLISQKVTPIVELDISHPDIRLNDGKVDRRGRFLSGTMHGNREPTERVIGGLYRLDPDTAVTCIVGDLATTNGPCFSPEGTTLYCADSTRQVIWAFDYDLTTGTPSNQRLFVDFRAMGTAPDGATIDSEGCLWTALVRSGQIARFSPEGQLLRLIDMPVTHPTSVAFGGPGLDILFVTSISASHRLRAVEKEAGWLFAIEGLGVTGIAEPRFAG
ncbi:SMP-30/gluconolactonase/LRE family protein [Roseomonas sp. GC11]|uniref:SMP-30/gluconolactonase/LRE family protein n=1 Tax=Roseomonas sp. GC11 TaxID=2950546 RepID=UPI00210CCFF3|nr:SMP-30/gluconolactonase/LRE family protein [Roseomonas sp. GC11]MCQ4159028.1 SMP-30/gluconolactonase/LRE family protein [Roseomonas sp. GC11]